MRNIMTRLAALEMEGRECGQQQMIVIRGEGSFYFSTCCYCRFRKIMTMETFEGKSYFAFLNNLHSTVSESFATFARARM